MTPNESFEDCLIRVVREITDLVRADAEPQYHKYQVWERVSPTTWRGTWEDRPAPPKYLRKVDWKQYGDQLQVSYRTRYPALPNMVGTGVTGWYQLTADRLISSIVFELCRRHPDLGIDGRCVAEFVKDLDALLTAKEVTFEFVVPLINFDMEDGFDSVDLKGGLQLIRMTSEQVSKIYGGSELLLGMRGRTSPVPCALTGTFSEPVCGNDDRVDSYFHTDLRPRLDLIVLGLQIFKPAAVALDGTHMTCKSYSPLVLAESSILAADAYVPTDGYCLTVDECESLKDHLAMFVRELHPVLKIACSRYGSAVVRRTAADRLLDAIVGLEAVLLHDAGAPKERGELSFRLAVRYATLVAHASDRKRAYRTMKGLYNARSRVVHGGDTGKSFDIGGQKLSPDEVAVKARDILREVILAFLPDGPQPRFVHQGFWDDQLFGDR